MPRSLDARLADAFRDARAAMSSGWPVCPYCYDGRDVRFEPAGRAGDPELRRYRCLCCVRRFSDLHGTPLEHTRLPLRVWALVLLGGSLHVSERALSMLVAVERHHVRAMTRKLHATATAAAWRETLQAVGITATSLVASYPEARQQAFRALSTSMKSACQPTRKRAVAQV